ncbi:hypothetical protein DsansV1_C14g0131561 [Dioscorea sansibarensis]
MTNIIQILQDDHLSMLRLVSFLKGYAMVGDLLEMRRQKMTISCSFTILFILVASHVMALYFLLLLSSI